MEAYSLTGCQVGLEAGRDRETMNRGSHDQSGGLLEIKVWQKFTNNIFLVNESEN